MIKSKLPIYYLPGHEADYFLPYREPDAYDIPVKVVEVESLLEELEGVKEGIVNALESTGTSTLHYKETMVQVVRLNNLIKALNEEGDR